ncbi:MAG: hypothetical protein O7B26_03930 [Planctomycetota bacterium]|nr:hypothetical protein [Planctomycetota bacterium]
MKGASMAAPRDATDSHSWETQDAPRISRKSIVIASVIYTLWLGFLAVIAAQRWISLQ